MRSCANRPGAVGENSGNSSILKQALIEILSVAVPYQQLYLSSYREFRMHDPSYPPKLEEQSSYSAVIDAFLDYDELISSYYLIQGFPGAAGDLRGKVVKPVDLKQDPSPADLEQALEQTFQSFINEFPPEEHKEFNSQFARQNMPLRIPRGTRACLKIEELPDFSQAAGKCKAKNAGILSDSEAF